MESSGAPGRIHLSQETADQLVTSGKQHWIKKRDQPVNAKGKGKYPYEMCLRRYGWLIDPF